MKVFETRKLSLRFGSVGALREVDVCVDQAEIVAVVGPNGAGKTTLLRLLGGLQKGYQGSLFFRGLPLPSWDRCQFARQVAYVPQLPQIIFPYTAREVALMGRLPHQEGVFFETEADHAAVQKALVATGSEHLADRAFNQLSGGERQLVVLASALAQEARVLLLDEPTAFLDLRHQLQLYQILGELNSEQGITIVFVTHDLNLAEAVSQRILMLKDGRLKADVAGSRERSPRLPAEAIAEVFGVTAARPPNSGDKRIFLNYRR